MRDRPLPAARARACSQRSATARSARARPARRARPRTRSAGCARSTTLLCGEHADCGARARGADASRALARRSRARSASTRRAAACCSPCPCRGSRAASTRSRRSLPACLSGLARAAARVSRGERGGRARARAYDPAGTWTRRARTAASRSRATTSARPPRLCRQDTKVVDFAERLFDARLAACRAQKELRARHTARARLAAVLARALRRSSRGPRADARARRARSRAGFTFCARARALYTRG